MIKGYCFKGLLQADGWLIQAYVEVDSTGKIISITNSPQNGHQYEPVEGYALPSFTNAHSHAFQYAMVGLTERHNSKKSSENFWSWREAMYKIALKVSPNQMEAIATKVYSEMLRHGYSHVVEFHYVHHDKNGKFYQNRAEIGERLIAAAKNAGIKITLVPIFYQKGGFGKNATILQRRFISSDLEEYFTLFTASKKACAYYEFANVGMGPHSLRAVDPELVKAMVQSFPRDIPFHIHLSEQIKEIKESQHYLGKRPVEWILDNVDVATNFNFVHCTHLNGSEVTELARSQANVVLCPSTEGNLGDGIFPLISYQEKKGRWSLGTDSQIGLNPFEDLRILDYGQRTKSHSRKTFYSDTQEDSGAFAIDQIVINGRQAAGNKNKKYFGLGQPFDALIIDSELPILNVSRPENLTSTIVYSSDASMHKGTILNGNWIIQNGKNINEEKINRAFVNALKVLQTR